MVNADACLQENENACKLEGVTIVARDTIHKEVPSFSWNLSILRSLHFLPTTSNAKPCAPNASMSPVPRVHSPASTSPDRPISTCLPKCAIHPTVPVKPLPRLPLHATQQRPRSRTVDGRRRCWILHEGPWYNNRYTIEDACGRQSTPWCSWRILQ